MIKLLQILGKARVHVAVFALSIILTTVLTWPFAQNISTYYTDSGDYTGFGSILYWSFESLVNGRIFDFQSYFNGYQVYPMPYAFTFTDHLFVPSLMFGIFYMFSQNYIFSVNLLSYISLVFSFISCYYVLNYFVKNFYASVIGAAIFTFNTITFAQFPQHAYLFNRVFLPPLFLFAYKFFKQPNIKDAFLTGLFFTLISLTVIYYQIYTTFLLLVLAGIFLLINIVRKNFSYIFRIVKNGMIFIIFIPILLYFNLPYLQFNGLESAKRSVDQNIYYSAVLADWFTAAPNNYLYKDMGHAFNEKRAALEEKDFMYPEEHSLFLNFIPMLLFSAAIFYFFRRLAPKDNLIKKFFASFTTSPIPLFTTILIITFLMTFGPFYLGWNSYTDGVKFPFYYFYHYLPFGQGVRVPTRFQFIFYLPFALFCAYGALYFFKNTKKFTIPLFIIILGLLVVENINTFSFDQRSYILPKVERLSENGELIFLKDKVTLHLPIIFPDFVVTEGVYHNWRVITNEKLVNMYSGYLPPEHIKLMMKLKEGVGLEDLKKLKAMGVNYLVMHRDLMDEDYYKNKVLKYDEIYDKGVIFNKEDTKIIDLNKYDFFIKRCDFDKDLEINLSEAVVSGSSERIKVSTIKNKSDCFYPSIYMDRYKDIDIYQNFIKITVQLKMPYLIEPYQEVVLGEIKIK